MISLSVALLAANLITSIIQNSNRAPAHPDHFRRHMRYRHRPLLHDNAPGDDALAFRVLSCIEQLLWQNKEKRPRRSYRNNALRKTDFDARLRLAIQMLELLKERQFQEGDAQNDSASFFANRSQLRETSSQDLERMIKQLFSENASKER